MICTKRTKTRWVFKTRALAAIVGAVSSVSVYSSSSFELANKGRILPPSLELERKVEPWCPGDCAVGVPFVVRYRRGLQQMVFVGAHHAFRPGDATMRAVDEGFAEIQPRVVIVEGFPTAMGRNPAPLVAEAHRYGTANADEFARGEAMYAASIALKQQVPFLGGEPTREEEIQVLKVKGFTDADIAFSGLLGGLSQALRSDDIPDTTPESLGKIYPHLVENLKLPLDRGGWNVDAPSLNDFRRRYRDTYGVELVGDRKFLMRIDIVGDTTRSGQQARADVMCRDRHLLALIEQQLAEKHSVLVVYGGSHWATLSAALQKRLGTPTIKPFLD